MFLIHNNMYLCKFYDSMCIVIGQNIHSDFVFGPNCSTPFWICQCYKKGFCVLWLIILQNLHTC